MKLLMAILILLVLPAVATTDDIGPLPTLAFAPAPEQVVAAEQVVVEGPLHSIVTHRAVRHPVRTIRDNASDRRKVRQVRRQSRRQSRREARKVRRGFAVTSSAPVVATSRPYEPFATTIADRVEVITLMPLRRSCPLCRP